VASSPFHSNLLGSTVCLYGAYMYAFRVNWPRHDSSTPIAPRRWKFAMALYIISFVSYGATIVFYTAAFPRLARNTPYSRQLCERYERGEIPVEEYEREQSLEKNRISNISTVSSLLIRVSLEFLPCFPRCTVTSVTLPPTLSISPSYFLLPPPIVLWSEIIFSHC